MLEAQPLFGKALAFIGTPKKFWPIVETLYRWVLMAGVKHFGAYYNYGRILQEHRKYELAAEQFRKALELNPDLSDACNNLGIVLCELGRCDESEKMFRRALAIEEYAKPHNNLAELYRRIGRLPEAKEEILRAVALDPEDPTVVSTLAQVLADMGEFAEAERRYMEALSIAPDDEEIHRELGRLLIRLKRPREGQVHLEKALALKKAKTPRKSSLDQWRGQSRASRQPRTRKVYGSKQRSA